MNTKGFTLVELLAVIIILALLALLASTSVTKLVKDSRDELSNTQIGLIKSAAEMWGADNIDKLPSSGQCTYITLGDLKEYGFLDSSIVDANTNKEISNDLKIKIVGTTGGFGNLVLNYEVDPENVDGCKPALSICTLASDSEKTGTELGAKYNCKVNPEKDAYTFYVLSNNTDNTTNLIMNRNIYYDSFTETSSEATEINTGLVLWINESDYASAGGIAWKKLTDENTYGPVTAMTYLYNATKDWTNVDPINYTYNDREVQGHADGEGYISFASTNGIATITPLSGDVVTIGSETEPLRARMPIYSRDSTKTEVSVSNGNNEYLYEYLAGLEWYGSGTQPTNNISGIQGYWTLSSTAYDPSGAWLVYYDGTMINDTVFCIGCAGVRPVITIDSSQLG